MALALADRQPTGFQVNISVFQLAYIILPASVLGVLKDLPAGALKVFIYLCSRAEGQPIKATIPTVTDATGIQRRSIVSALNTLRERKLITCISGSGNQPNKYGIPLPKRQETAAPPGTKASQATLPSSTPTQATSQEQITAPPHENGPGYATSPNADATDCPGTRRRRLPADRRPGVGPAQTGVPG